MKKIVTYFFTLGLFLLVTSHTFSFATNSVLVSNSINSFVNSNQITKSVNYLSPNSDTILYNYDNDDSENFNSSIGKKNTVIGVTALKRTSNYTNFICLKSPRKGYFSINSSRLPRFTFIILQVLRL
ncbi:MAG: hypothetical protein R2805_01455 [Flavobacterium sp.]|jgi:hypothetical protein|uniref:hypothetical protein n=1 Tax=Flavobacterium sp. TaxID=239 RepID=UPI0035294744